MDRKTELDPSSAAPASITHRRQSAHSDLQYVSLQVDGKTYGGWYRMLADGRMELLALANIQSERRPENTPIDQARAMLADFVRAARSKEDANGSARTNGNGDDTIKTDQRESGRSTLGDLLYADTEKVHPLEEEWTNLVRSIAAADPLALHQLLERTQRMVFTLIMRLVDDRRSAEELTLDVYEHIWQHAGDYDADTGSVIGWIMNLARSKAIERLQRENRTRQLESALSNQKLRDALKELSPDEREMIETVFFFEQSYAQAAELAQELPAMAKARIYSGLEKIRAALPGGTTES